MANVINKQTMEARRSVHTPAHDPAKWLINPPGFDAVAAIPARYRKIIDDDVVAMTPAEREAVDAAANAAAQAADKSTAIATLSAATPLSRAVRAIAVVAMREIRALKQRNPRPQATLEQLISEAAQAVQHDELE